MSIVRVAWAMQTTTGSATRKAVLIALADMENQETGKCCPKMQTLADRIEMSVSTVERALRDLAKAGIIDRQRSRRQDGSLGVYYYSFGSADPPEPPGAAPGGPPGNDAEATRQSDGSRGTRSEPVTDLEPVKPERPPDETYAMAMASSILTRWNDATGQSLSAREWRLKIRRRIEEHPELTYDDHVEIILANLNHPWWSGPPTPSVVYGNGAQFERAMMTQAHGTPAGAAGALAVALDEQRRMEAGR